MNNEMIKQEASDTVDKALIVNGSVFLIEEKERSRFADKSETGSDD